MSHEIDVQAQPRAWLMHSILQPHVSKYAEHLHRGRYAANTRRVYLCCVAHFAHWLTDERHTFDLVNEAGIARFISEHLPRCKCSYPVRRCDYEIRAAVAQLLEVLRAGGAISDELGVEDHIGRELVQFDAYIAMSEVSPPTPANNANGWLAGSSRNSLVPVRLSQQRSRPKLSDGSFSARSRAGAPAPSE
jgi:hypothetical protein